MADVQAAPPTQTATPPAPAAGAQLAVSPSRWRGRIDACKRKRKTLVTDWKTNVNYRRGKPFETDSDEDRVAVNLDWSMTKSKQAQLFSQVPQVVLTAENAEYRPAIPVFAKELNDTLTRARMGVALDEVLPDTINAAGIGAVIVTYEARTVEKDVPAISPATLPPHLQLALATGAYKIPTKKVPHVLDKRFCVERISPGDLLWPAEFKGSDFDKAPWLGRSGRMTWAEAQRTYKLADDVKSKVVGEDRSAADDLSEAGDQTNADSADADTVSFDEIFYWRYLYHADEMYFTAIHHLVFINGIDTAVVDEPWKGQRFDSEIEGYLGACRFPIRVLTLTYISDEAIPPSDSAIGRPQVNELIRSRSQMILQRDHSVPVRWFDVNRTDPAVQDNLMRGHWQGMVPVQGDGSRILGEVARATYPKEEWDFDRVAKGDLQESWQVGANQTGSFASGERSAAEANIVQSNFQTRIGYERGRVAALVVGIAEVMAGLLALYGDFDLPEISEEDMQRLQSWDRKRINHELAFSIRADSTVLLDAEQRIQRLLRFLNMTAKSGYVDSEPIITEIAELTGLDPARVVRKPQPQGPDESNVSFRFSGEDLLNPVAIAILMKSGQAPTPDILEAAKALIAAATNPTPPPAAPAAPAAPGGTGATGAEPPPAVPAGGAHPDWNMADRINTRRDGSEQ